MIKPLKLKRVTPYIFMAGLLAVMLLLILYPERYIKSSMDGITLFVTAVLPSLFPFFFITAILTRMRAVSKLSKVFSPLTKRLFNCSGISSYVYLMSILSGYPVGSKIISELRQSGAIGKNEATRMSAFCSTSGPLFIIGSIGLTMLGNKRAGLIIYLCHILSGLITGLIFRFYGKKEEKSGFLPAAKPKVDNIMGDAMYSSVISILTVGGFITVFCILADMLVDFNLLLPLYALISLLLLPFTKDFELSKYIGEGLIEGTKGCSLLAAHGGPLVLPAISFVIAFGGLSIILQQIVHLKKADVNIGIFLLSKLLHALLSFALCFVATTWL